MKFNTILMLSLMLLSSCQSPNFNPKSEVALPESFESSKTLPTYNADLTKWWQEWHDPYLNALIEEGLANSNSIKAARQNIEVAKAYQSIVKADLWPMVGLLGQKSRLNSDFENPVLKDLGINNVDTDFHMQQVGLLSKWDLDLFGQKQNKAKSAYYNRLTTEEMFHASQMSLSSRIAEDYFNAIAIQHQIQITEQGLQQLQRLLKYTKGRFEAGQANPNDINKIKGNITQLESQQELLHSQFDNTQQSIATLVGKPPQNYRLKYQMQTLSTVPPIPTGVKPSEMVYRRPDLMARQKQIAAAVAKTAAAKADLFPKFYINFGLLDGKIGINSLAKSAFKGPLFDVGFDLPIFTAGKIKANIKANEAMLQKSLYDYDDALLNALKEIDGAYRWRIAYDKSVASLNSTEQSMLKRSSDSEKLFKYGEITYEQVPLNHLDYLKAKEETVRQQLNAARATILLYQALGGGWQENL